MSNSNHDPKNKECAIYGEEHEKEIECEHPCTCRPEQKEEWVEEWDKYSNVEIVDPVPFFCTQIALAEERGRREVAENDLMMLKELYMTDSDGKFCGRFHLVDIIPIFEKTLSTLTQKS